MDLKLHRSFVSEAALNGELVQLARTFGLQSKGHEFESRILHPENKLMNRYK